ncbi:hypothetical protein [Mycobacterium sp.]|uniref:hypothetical protein n=1 Tax=Mycobacterium sp. TaxID=1785 RepID=UPI003D0E4A48
MFVITLVAVGAAVAAWLRPVQDRDAVAPLTPTFSSQQVFDAQSRVCAAYAKIHHAVDTNASRTGGNDPTAQLAVAVNMRQVYVVGSAHLFTALADEPATATDLAAATRKIAGMFQDLALEGLASDDTAPTLAAINQTGAMIERQCK